MTLKMHMPNITSTFTTIITQHAQCDSDGKILKKTTSMCHPISQETTKIFQLH